MNKLVSLGGVAVLAISLSACATVTRGTKETFRVQTTPTGANVEMSNGTKCVSPCEVKLKRKDGFTVIARKEGYQDATAKVESKVKGGGVAGAAGNVIFGGIIGAAVDGSNGSMRDLTPNPLVMVLQPLSVPAAAAVIETAPAAEAPAPAEAAPAPNPGQ